MPNCPHITIFKPGGCNPILEIQIKINKGLCLYCICKVNTQKVANILPIYKKCTISAALCVYNVNSQCTVKNFQKKKKNHLFSGRVLNLVAACFNNWEREGHFSEVLSLAFSHYREREREWRKRHGSTTIRNFHFHMNNSTKNTRQVNPYIVSKKKKSIYICNIKTPCKLLDHSSSRLFSSSYSSQAITFFSHSFSSDSIIIFPLSLLLLRTSTIDRIYLFRSLKLLQ